MTIGLRNPGKFVAVAAAFLQFSAVSDSLADEQAAFAAPQLIDIPFEQLLTLEVSSASRYSQKIGEAPSAAVVVDAGEIRTHGYRTLADVLRSMPGLYITDDHSWSYIGVRGFSRPGDYNTRVLLLVDGYRVNDNIYNQAYIGNEFLVDIDMIERVEFIPGPGASAYGDNAFFGVINVITKSASALQGAAVTVEAGSHNAFKSSFRYGGRLDNGAEIVASIAQYDSKGRDWYFPEYGAVAHDLDEERYTKFFTKLSYKGWAFEGGYMKRPRHNPAAPYDAVFGDERLETVDTHAYANASYQTDLSATLQLSGNLNYGVFDYDGIYPYPASVLNIDRSRGRRAGAEVRLLSTAFAGHKLMGGAEYQKDLRQLQRNYDQSPHFDYINTDQTPHKYGVFVQDEYAIRDDLLLNAGLRYDHYSAFGGTANPRVALVYHPSAGNGVKLIYGSAYRAPNAYEMFYGDESGVYRTNPDLRPERIKTYELVVEKQLGNKWNGTMSVFHYDVESLITQVEDGSGNLMFINGGDMHTSGVEFSAARVWASGARLKGSLGYNEARDKSNDAWLVNSPHVTGKLALALPLPDAWQAGAELQYTSPRHTVGGKVSSYTLASLTLNRTNILKGLDLSISAYNLLDKEYEDPADTGAFVQDVLRQDGRTFRVKLDYRF